MMGINQSKIRVAVASTYQGEFVRSFMGRASIFHSLSALDHYRKVNKIITPLA